MRKLRIMLNLDFNWYDSFYYSESRVSECLSMPLGHQLQQFGVMDAEQAGLYVIWVFELAL